LRGRAARMDPIADLAALMPVVDALLKRGLMVELSPPGRGQIVSHNLYKERELAELKAQYAGHTSAPGYSDSEDPPAPRAMPAARIPADPTQSQSRQASPLGVTADLFAELEVEVAELRAEVMRLRERVNELEAKLA